MNSPNPPIQGGHPTKYIGVELFVILAFAMVVCTVAYRFCLSERDAIETAAHQQLEQVTAHKAAELSEWRAERLGDARVSRTVLRMLHESKVGPVLNQWLDSARQNYGYANILLMSERGQVIAMSGAPLAPPEHYASLVQELTTSNSARIQEFPPTEDAPKPHFVTGIRVVEAGQPVRVLLFGIDPATYLFPQLLKWPTALSTGRLVLVKREDASTLILSELEGRPDSEIRPQRQLSDKTSVIVRAVQGEPIVSGRISTGEAVEASAHRVEGSDWYVVSTIHATELYSQADLLQIQIWVVSVLVVLLGAVSIEAIRRRHLSNSYKRHYIAEMEKQAIRGHYDYLTRYANDAILLADENRNIVEVNERCSDYYGYSRDEMLGMNISQLRSPESRPDHEETWQTLQREKRLVFEVVALRNNGSVFPAEISIRVIEINGKKFVQGIVRDITERKSVERQIRRLNRLYRTLSQCGQAAIHARSEQELYESTCRLATEYGGFLIASVGTFEAGTGEIVQVAKSGEAAGYLAHARMTVSGQFGVGPAGRSIREGRVATCNDIQNDPSMEQWREAAAKYELRSSLSMPLRRGGTICGHLSFYSGESGFFSTEEVALATEIGDTISFALDALDRERRRRAAEEDLRSSRERLELVLDATNEGYWDWNFTTREFHQNLRYSEMLGYQPGELQPGYDAWLELIHPEDREKFAQLWKTLQHNETGSAEFRIRRKDGTVIWSMCHGKVVAREADQSIARLVGTLTDVTERKQMEEQFLQSQKLEVVGRLAGGVAHDFNNLLTVINGYSKMLIEKTAPNARARKFADHIHSAGESAAELTRQLLTFSRRSTPNLRPTELGRCVRGSETILRRLVGEEVELRTTLGAQLDWVRADPSQIQQCVMNLVVNARDAMDKGGRIMLVTETRQIRPGEAPEGSAAGSYVVLRVSDTGAGMDPETQKRLFEPFFTTKEVGKGTGLGLSTVYGIVKQSKGFIRVQSAPGAGSAFELYFPRVEPDSVPTAARKPEESLIRSESILVVEDQDNVRAFLKEALGELGYRVLEASGGAEALEIAKNKLETIDLLLTDVVMPQMSGEELADLVQVTRPAVKVLFMSGYTRGGISLPNTISGSAFIQKPFTLELLAGALSGILHPTEAEMVEADIS